MNGEAKPLVWNFRVLKQQYEGEEDGSLIEEYGIVEAYYDEDGEPRGYCDPHVLGDSAEELRVVLRRMRDALDKPILVTGDFKREQTRPGLDGPKPTVPPRDLKDHT